MASSKLGRYNPRMLGIRHWLWVVGLLALVLAACGGSDDATPYEDLLRLVPDTPEMRSDLFMNDYALFRELFDGPLPGPDASEQEMAEYYAYLPQLGWTDGQFDVAALRGPFLSDGFGEFRPLIYEHRNRYLDFDIRNEDQTLTAGLPAMQLEIMRGRFDPEATGRALSACSGECVSPDAQEEYRGVTFYSWGEDYASGLKVRKTSAAFDQWGGRIAVLDDYVIRTLGTGDMRAAIDAGNGDVRSLADVEEYRLMAKGMSEMGAYGVFMTDQTQEFDRTAQGVCDRFAPVRMDCDVIRDELLNFGPLLRPYQTYAAGVGQDSGGGFTAVVIVHDDAGTGKENAELLRRRIEDGGWTGAVSWTEYIDPHRMAISARSTPAMAAMWSASA